MLSLYFANCKINLSFCTFFHLFSFDVGSYLLGNSGSMAGFLSALCNAEIHSPLNRAI